MRSSACPWCERPWFDSSVARFQSEPPFPVCLGLDVRQTALSIMFLCCDIAVWGDIHCFHTSVITATPTCNVEAAACRSNSQCGKTER